MHFALKHVLVLCFRFKFKRIFCCIGIGLILEITLYLSTRDSSRFTAQGSDRTESNHSLYRLSTFIHEQSFVKTWYGHCNDRFRRTHLITPGLLRSHDRTGTLLFHIFSVLALARNNCYTPVLKPSDYLLKLDDIFDIKGVDRSQLNDTNFLRLEDAYHRSRYFNRTFFSELDTNRNWTLNGYHQSYKLFNHQEKFLKSSVLFKPEIIRRARCFLKVLNTVQNQICGVHVRRTDKLFLRPDLSWYRSYLHVAMKYVEERVPGVKFLFVSDDIKWCRDNFRGANIYFSPFTNPGEDLALLSLSNHSITTIDTFGWMGAWLGNKSENALIIYRGYNPDFFPQRWVRL